MYIYAFLKKLTKLKNKSIKELNWKSNLLNRYLYFVDDTFLVSIIKLNPFQSSVAPHIEISSLISNLNQMTVF